MKAWRGNEPRERREWTRLRGKEREEKRGEREKRGEKDKEERAFFGWASFYVKHRAWKGPWSAVSSGSST